MTLREFSRALAVHALMTSRPDLLTNFFAPETSEGLADVIERFAKGEPLERPRPSTD